MNQKQMMWKQVCDQNTSFAFSYTCIYLWWDLYEGGLYFMVQACVLQGVVDSHFILLCQKSEVNNVQNKYGTVM